MKKICIISDTHSFFDDNMKKYFIESDEVWHAGDIGSIDITNDIKRYSELKAVYGNIDNAIIRNEFPLHNRFLCEQIDVWITHIGGYPGRYTPKVRESLNNNPPKLFITGHSHILKVINDKKLDLLHMNPGAAGIHGFHQVRTMLRFEIHKDKIQKLEVIEIQRN